MATVKRIGGSPVTTKAGTDLNTDVEARLTAGAEAGFDSARWPGATLGVRPCRGGQGTPIGWTFAWTTRRTRPSADSRTRATATSVMSSATPSADSSRRADSAPVTLDC